MLWGCKLLEKLCNFCKCTNENRAVSPENFWRRATRGPLICMWVPQEAPCPVFVSFMEFTVWFIAYGGVHRQMLGC